MVAVAARSGGGAMGQEAAEVREVRVLVAGVVGVSGGRVRGGCKRYAHRLRTVTPYPNTDTTDANIYAHANTYTYAHADANTNAYTDASRI